MRTINGGALNRNNVLAADDGRLRRGSSVLRPDAFMGAGEEGRCLLYAIACGLCHITDEQKTKINSKYKKLIPRDYRSLYQREQLRLAQNLKVRQSGTILSKARALMKSITLKLDELSKINIEKILRDEKRLPCKTEIDKLQQALVAFRFLPYNDEPCNYKIVIYASDTKCFYEGSVPNNGLPTKNINLMLVQEHFFLIKTLTGTFGSSYFCEKCKKAYGSLHNHRVCPEVCDRCFASPRCLPIVGEDPFPCNNCNREFISYLCYRTHTEKICAKVRICKKCCRLIRERNPEEHDCDSSYCKVCLEIKKDNHDCMIRKYSSSQQTNNHIFAFYDLETKIVKEEDCNVLKPNLCVVQTVCDMCIKIQDSVYYCEDHGNRQEIFHGDDCVKEFVTHLLTLNVKSKCKSRQPATKITAIAHNSSRFDAVFIAKFLYEQNLLVDDPQFISDGRKFYCISFKGVRFIDSLNFLQAPLKKLPEMFDLRDLEKGSFPHLFNVSENAQYDGPFPDIKYYDPDSMNEKEREKFLVWYSENCHKNFNFAQELVRYCCSDVEILRKACLKFYETMYDDCGIKPFIDSITIASFVNKVYRSKFYLTSPSDVPLSVTPLEGYRFRDKQSFKAIQYLLYFEKEIGQPIESSYRGREVKIRTADMCYKVDGYFVDELGGKHVVEYNGCFFHGHSCLNKNGKLYVDKECEDMEENRAVRRERTRRKEAALQKAGYILHSIWECEFDATLARYPHILKGIEKFEMDCLKPRDAFFGGNTDCTAIFDMADKHSRINYVDFTSLYPFCLATMKTPVGAPTAIYVGAEQCSGVDLETFEGFIKCTVLPPKNIFHPVLPQRINGKLMFPLCLTCAVTENRDDCNHSDAERQIKGTWVVDEVKESVKQGYRIVEIFEMVEYQVVLGYFRNYIHYFYKMKLYASGYPEGYTAENIDEYIAQVFEREGIQLEKDKFVESKPLRSLAKALINVLWGKFAQGPKSTCRLIKTPVELIDIVFDPKHEVQSIEILNENAVLITFKAQEEFPNRNTNIAVAAYTTCNARLHLNKSLRILGKRAIYNDTDSIIYKHDTREAPLIQTGPFLGDLTNELVSYGKNAYIVEFASGGAKNYAYKVFCPDTNKYFHVAKVKGITLNYKNSQKINFESICDAMLAEFEDREPEPMIAEQTQFRSNVHADMMTKTVHKKWRAVITKRRKYGMRTVPYGFDLIWFNDS